MFFIVLSMHVRGNKTLKLGGAVHRGHANSPDGRCRSRVLRSAHHDSARRDHRLVSRRQLRGHFAVHKLHDAAKALPSVLDQAAAVRNGPKKHSGRMGDGRIRPLKISVSEIPCYIKANDAFSFYARNDAIDTKTHVDLVSGRRFSRHPASTQSSSALISDEAPRPLTRTTLDGSVAAAEIAPVAACLA